MFTMIDKDINTKGEKQMKLNEILHIQNDIDWQVVVWGNSYRPKKYNGDLISELYEKFGDYEVISVNLDTEEDYLLIIAVVE